MNQDRSEMRREVAPGVGKAYWRSLDELADTPAFRDWVERRFPQSMRELLDGGIDRRRFLQLMAASIGLAGLSGCRRPESNILPYTKPPEEVVPGRPNYYATAMPRSGWASPILVESHEGRPTKVEGTPNHPDSAGATDAYAQASVLDLYDPDRLSPVLRGGVPSTWEAYDAFATDHFAAIRNHKGQGLHVLSEDLASPALEHLREHLRSVMPEARWHIHEAISSANARAGAVMAFGSPVVARPRFDRAEVVLALDCDFLGLEEEGGRHLLGFAEARRLQTPSTPMNRLYAVESRFSLTGGMADHRLRLPASQVRDYTVALARVILAGSSASASLQHALEATTLGKEGPWNPGSTSGESSQPDDSQRADKAGPWIQEVANDLKTHAGRALLIAGRRQPPLVHAMVHAMNAALGNLGKTVECRSGSGKTGTGTLEELAQAVGKRQVETLVILGGNPAYDAPADLEFAALMKQVTTTIRLGLHADETSREATWHLPAAHYLESWGDARAGDGTVVPIQPLIEPLDGGRTILEVVAQLSAFETTAPYEIVRRSFRKVSRVAEAEFELAWRKFLHDGRLSGSEYPVVKPVLQWTPVASAVASARPATERLSADHLELVLDRDAKVDDGRFANNGWLQELPDPISKLTWDNAAIFSPATARALGVATGDMVRLDLAGRTLEIPVLILPGQADFSVAVPLGYGRTSTGRVGIGVGFNAYLLRTSASPDIALGLKAARTGRNYPLACTQDHFTMEGRDLVREESLTDLREPSGPAHAEPEPGELITRPTFDGEHQWGMVIDLNTCIGCNACMVACQSENNIPIVGKDEVARGREMHWIRLDRYFTGDEADPGLIHQPVACVHCENAPCEVVCPVNATVHSDEGLNVQVYSRCIGTRYCANNCPYKVRRFNFYNYNERPLDQLRLGPLTEKGMAEPLKMQKNPDVTVRIRGIMEKCTYCVQRIEQAKIGAGGRRRVGAHRSRGRYDRSGLRANLPRPSDRFRRPLRPRESGLEAQEPTAKLFTPRRIEHRTPNDLPVPGAEPEPEDGRPPRGNPRMSSRVDTTSAPVPLIEGGHDFGTLTSLVCGLVEGPTPLWWWIAMAIAGPLCALGGVMTVYVISTGIGVWGMNQTIGWAFDITNFVFWVGIGHAGTLISAILFLFRQKWRSSLNRFAEAMTLFAVACAGLFVTIHLGRVWVFWYLIPAPNANEIYPNFRSPLSWDFAAVATYATVSTLFWYYGLIPDLATLRDRATGWFRQRIYGLLALGWRGSARHWHNYETGYLMLAGLATPLVVSVHTIVSFDFATSVIPGWHTTIFPPYFVNGAIFSGLAMVITLIVPLRILCGLRDLVTTRHLENMCKLILATGMLMGYGYFTEIANAWYSGNPFEQYVAHNRATGPYAWCFWTMVACNVVFPQLFWFRWFRTTPWAMFVIAVLVNVGMWLERFVIVVVSLSRDFLPSSWMMFYPTWVDLALLAGGFGLFATPFLLFIRFVPMVALSEVKACLPEADPHHPSPQRDEPAEKPDSADLASIEGDREASVYGIMARFRGPTDLVAAAERLRESGYRRFDAYSPFPIHGMDKAIGLTRSKVPAFTLAGGLFGFAFAQSLQWYQSVVGYPLITGGKPLNSTESFVPISFETTILYAAFGSIAGMLLLNGLPRLYHPVFRGRTFASTTNDGFFLTVAAADPKFDPHEIRVVLEELGGTKIELLDK